MRILCVCDHGTSRSPTIASLLRVHGHDTIPVGAETASLETRRMLSVWCELAIFTDPGQRAAFPDIADARARVWPIADVYPRPFNPELYALLQQLIPQEGLAGCSTSSASPSPLPWSRSRPSSRRSCVR